MSIGERISETLGFNTDPSVIDPEAPEQPIITENEMIGVSFGGSVISLTGVLIDAPEIVYGGFGLAVVGMIGYFTVRGNSQ